MGRILRVGLMVLLAAVLGVGNAWGDGEEYTDGNGVTWKCYWTVGYRARSIVIPERNRGSISGFVKIPETVVVNGESLTVVKIGEDAFKDCIGLTGVTIPGSVTEIGWGAFSGCSGLMSVTIPNSVARIGVDAFRDCIGLTAVTIPSRVTKIGGFAFCGCSGLTSVTISDGVTEIGREAFEDCSGLQAVTIPSSVTKIEIFAFYGCSGLNAVYWLAKANCSVEDGAFAGMTSPTTLCVRQREKAAIEGNGQTWWKKFDKIVEFCVVIFQDGEGNKLGEQRVVLPDGTATVPTDPTKEGYIVEWQLDGGKYDFSAKVTKDITLVAKWKKAVKYTVTFDAKGGTTTTDVQMVEEGKAATEPKAPTKEGYTFVEWQLGGKKYDFSTAVAEDITLVAKWKKAVKYTVTFDAKGGTPAPDVQMVEEGKAATEPKAPTREGYTFVEWQLKDTKYDFSTKVTKDITLVAVWKKKEKSTPSTPKDPKDSETAVESVQLAGVRVVQNPIANALVLEGISTAERIEVYSLTGVQTYACAPRGEERMEIATGSWASGIYVVRIIATDGEKAVRVVKR